MIPPPIQLFLEMTSACNLRCAHCYLRAGEDVRTLPAPLVHELLAEFHDLGGQYVSISGGEPTLHYAWRSAVRLARSLGFPCLLISNGTSLSRDAIDFIIDTGTALTMSVDGASPRIHDTIRGAGAFDKTMTSLRYAAARGYGGQMTLAFTPMAVNVMDLPGVVALANHHGIGTVYISLLEHRGRAADRAAALQMSDSEKRALLFTIFSLQERYPDIAIECVNLKGITERLRGIPLETESLDRTMRITPAAEIYLTAYLDAEEFHLGAYAPGALAAAWQNEKVRRALDGASQCAPQCRTCALWEACRGGSSALAWIRNGSHGGVDGYCEAKRAVFGGLAGSDS